MRRSTIQNYLISSSYADRMISGTIMPSSRLLPVRKQVRDIRPGQKWYVTPWQIYLTSDGGMWIDHKCSVSSEICGTFSVGIEATDDGGIIVDLREMVFPCEWDDGRDKEFPNAGDIPVVALFK